MTLLLKKLWTAIVSTIYVFSFNSETHSFSESLQLIIKVSLKNGFNMCLNGGTFYPGTGCLCVDNFSGDFCDECLPGWTGDQCDNPQNMCDTTSDGINCYGKWLFNLTLLDMPITAKGLLVDIIFCCN